MIDEAISDEKHASQGRLRGLLGLGLLALLVGVYFYFLYNALTDQIKF